MLALLLALVAVQAAAMLLVRTTRVHGFLTRQVEISFGRTVEVRRYSASLFPSPQIDAYDISIGEDPSFGHEYFLRAARLSAGLRWTGLLAGRFEFGTLQLERPSLVLTRKADGRWNLERWLPTVAPAPPSAPSRAGSAMAGKADSHATPAYRLQKIEIRDGRANFKMGDDKASFAFIQVQGSVEQTAPGRWQLDLEAEPWRSGVPLQLAGTVRVRGDVAGTSARLQPAHFQFTWEKSSLADVFRLLGGRDFGVRGLFASEGTLESGGGSGSDSRALSPGDWTFSVQARASSIHRWDLTERDDNPRLGVHLNGRWNPGAGTLAADLLVLQSPRSNVRGTASLQGGVLSGLQVEILSAGVQAADLLDWYRGFHPDVAEGARAEQYFTGTASLSGWPPVLTDAAMGSGGGRWTIPGFATPIEVRAIRGSARKRKLTVEPFTVILPSGSAAGSPSLVAGTAPGTAILPLTSASLSLQHDFDAAIGAIRVEGQTTRLAEIFNLADALGSHLQNGWDLRGRASADLRWEWSRDKSPAWTGHADFSQATLQITGLNQPIQIENARAEWRPTGRRLTLGKVGAFGASWSGFVEQAKIPPREFGESEIAPWSFQLQADHLDAADLDRWMGPRARPNWLQRLLPTGLGGAAASNPSGTMLGTIRASGDLRIDEVAVEKIHLKQFHAQAKLDRLNLSLSSIQAQWAGGEVKGNIEGAISAKPVYEIAVSFDRVSLTQTPWLARVSDRLAGAASGTLQLHATGIGRDALLASLSGKGELQLSNVELRGWDLPGTMAYGEWKTGVSRWASGAGTFHLSDGGFDLNALRLTSSAGDFLLKGSVSFSEDTDLTAESRANGKRSRTENSARFLQISGPLAEPTVSLEKSTAQ